MNNDAAVTAFTRNVCNIQNACDEIAEFAADHFSKSPDDINWGHVGTAGDILKKLEEIREMVSAWSSQ